MMPRELRQDLDYGLVIGGRSGAPAQMQAVAQVAYVPPSRDGPGSALGSGGLSAGGKGAEPAGLGRGCRPPAPADPSPAAGPVKAGGTPAAL